MKKSDKNKKLKILATSMASASILTSCGTKESKEIKDWRKAPGTNGFINLGDVVEAFQKHRKVTDFEKRVNEIFEGDNLVVFKSGPLQKSDRSGLAPNGFYYIAYEDLDKSGGVSSSSNFGSQADDPLFRIQVYKDQATLYGLGVNKYYEFSWTYKPAEEKKEESHYRSHYASPYYHHWYHGRGWNSYYTPREKYSSNSKDRTNYRKSSDFINQVDKNTDWEKKVAREYGKSFTSSAGSQSTSRKSYIQKTASSNSITSTVRSNPTSQIRSSSGSSSTYSAAAVATGAVVAAKSRGGSFGRSRGSSGIGV